MKKKLGKALKARRKELNLDLETLSIHCGIPSSVLSNIENAKANPTVNTLEKIMLVLGLTLQVKIIER